MMASGKVGAVVTTSGAAMRILRTCVFVCCGVPVSCTCTVKLVPVVAAVGAPLITPEELSVKPAGSDPLLRLQVKFASPPVADRVCVYDAPTTPSARDVVAISSGCAMVMLKLRKATLGFGAEVSVSDTEKLKRPDAVGVPEIIPVGPSSASPGGNAPLTTAQTAGALPPKKLSEVV